MEETLVYALLRTTRKLHSALQMRDPDRYSCAEQQWGEGALVEWLAERGERTDLADEVREYLESIMRIPNS